MDKCKGVLLNSCFVQPYSSCSRRGSRGTNELNMVNPAKCSNHVVLFVEIIDEAKDLLWNNNFLIPSASFSRREICGT